MLAKHTLIVMHGGFPSVSLATLGAAALVALWASLALAAAPDPEETVWGGAAELAYESGFARNVRKHAEGGVCLFDMELVENDAPGSGYSEKGVCTDTIWGPHQARKILQLADPRARRAFLLLFTNSEDPPYALHFKVNGHAGRMTKENHEAYRWVEFPADVLKAGANVVELSCPEAATGEEGWNLYLARADEFLQGGGSPQHVGETSFRSDDGGATWKESPFGEEGRTRAEYTIRLSLDRYLPKGTLETPVVDLWRGAGEDLFVPLRQIRQVTFAAKGVAPVGTEISYYVRRGTSPDSAGEEWGDWEPIGSGPGLRATIDGASFNRRFAQVRAVLATRDPLVSPVLHSIRVHAAVADLVTPLSNLHVVSTDNPKIRHPSVRWEWERSDRPEFAELRQRENLDELLAGCRTQFQAQTRLMDHATKRWRAGGPTPAYPGWDALGILNRIDQAGSGGMCIQGNNFLGGMCMAFGWQARLVNITAHETCEVWNDDFGKWIYLDGYYVNHTIHDTATGEPMGILEMHRRFLDRHYPDRPIDWMHDPMRQKSTLNEFGVELGVGGPREPIHDGISLAAFARMVPRNNWYEKPYPRPLSHGKTWWPWDGYVNWYDERTPPKRQYSWHTDRPQDMWPVLNRVRVHATSAAGDDRLFLHFETYTPNFDHIEVDVDDTGWKQVGERWAWFLQAGRNTLRARAVSKAGVGGKPSILEINRVAPP